MSNTQTISERSARNSISEREEAQRLIKQIENAWKTSSNPVRAGDLRFIQTWKRHLRKPNPVIGRHRMQTLKDLMKEFEK